MSCQGPQHALAMRTWQLCATACPHSGRVCGWKRCMAWQLWHRDTGSGSRVCTGRVHGGKWLTVTRGLTGIQRNTHQSAAQTVPIYNNTITTCRMTGVNIIMTSFAGAVDKLQERLASSAVSHRVSTLYPYNTRLHNRQHKAALETYRSPGQGHRA